MEEIPVMLILGLVGIFAMILGPSYGVYLVKHGEYRDGLVNALLITLVGFALFLAFLMGG